MRSLWRSFEKATAKLASIGKRRKVKMLYSHEDYRGYLDRKNRYKSKKIDNTLLESLRLKVEGGKHEDHRQQGSV